MGNYWGWGAQSGRVGERPLNRAVKALRVMGKDPVRDLSTGTSDRARASVEKQGQCSRVKEQMKEWGV